MQFLSGGKRSSLFYKLILGGLLLCMMLLENHIEILIPIETFRSKVKHPEKASATHSAKESLKTKAISVDTGTRMEITTKEGKVLILHKLLQDNGPVLSAKQRAKLVKERCQTFLQENNIGLNSSAKSRYDDEAFLISSHYNLSICYNCKVVSTNTKRVLYALDHKFTGDINNIRRPATRKFSKTCTTNFHQLMSERRQINLMMVREPLERLLSAYRDERAFVKQIKDPSFTFEKYLQLILDEDIKYMDRHIYPYFERCRPCEMQFDYIGLQSHFTIDMKIVLEKIDARGKVGIPERKKTGYNYVSSRRLLKLYFKKIPNDMIHKLWEKYYKDYFIFGFPYPTHLMDN